MHLKITQFEDLLISVKKFGVTFLSNTIIKEMKKEKKQFENEGLDTDLSDVFATNNQELFIILKNGDIRRSIIHIVDISSWNVSWGYPRFHIDKCEKIEEMINNNRGFRYKASSRDDGQFYLIKKERKWYESLEICSHCLELYNKQFKSQKTKQNFPLQEYIKKPIEHSGFKDIQIDHCTVPNIYTNSWRDISLTVKKQNNYLCSICNKDLSKPECRKFLHTHHINSNKKDNTRENLQSLCIKCHSKEYNHSHIKQSEAYKAYLNSNCC